jgi:peptide/nickel transport system substrate-binding protein
MLRGSALAAPFFLLGLGPVQAKPAGAITIAMPQVTQSFDPTAMVGTTPYLVADYIFDGLVDIGPKGMYPALATSWKISPDGKQMDFNLRQGVKFHNGDAFTAEDVKFTYERIMAPDSTHSFAKQFQDAIDHIDAPTPDMVRFFLKQPWPVFFTSTRYSMQPIVPKNYYTKVGAKSFLDHPVGTGPYKLVEFKAGEWNKFEANDSYWGDAPKVKSVTQIVVKEPFTRYAMLKRGEADIVTGLAGPLLEKIKTDPDVKIYLTRYTGTSGIMFNKDLFPEAADKRVRLAIGYAIDRAAIGQKILGGVCQPASSMATPGTYGYLKGLPQIPYDPSKAKALLKEAGVAPGYKLTFAIQTQSFNALPNAPQVLEAIAGYLEAVGFTVERRNVDNAAWISMMRGHKPTSIFYAPITVPDDGGEIIQSYFVSWSGWTAQSVKIPEYDQIYSKETQEPNVEERMKLLHRFAALESQNQENIPLLWCDEPFAANTKTVKNWQPSVLSSYHMNIKSVELAK